MLDFTKLVSQGRAKAPGKPWTAEELEALILLERERKLQRTVAADFIRNGVMTLEAYDNAVKAKFEPKTIEDTEKIVEETLKAEGAQFEPTPKVKEKRKKKDD